MDNSYFSILIADDELGILEICADIFEAEGFKVFQALDGNAALEIFLNHQIDFILSDSHMPMMNGLELLEEVVKSDKKTPPFFIFTGDIGINNDDLKERGALAIISKPFDLDELLKKVIATLLTK